jgi:DNA/RNA-binding domain of Phe-tRNA-synthetase-like protein
MNKVGLKYSVDPEIFQMFPDYLRGVVLAYRVENGPSPDELKDALREAEKMAANNYAKNDLAANPRIESWRAAYKAFGAKPTKFRPSMEAMIRRVLKGHEAPSINSAVDIGNIVSLRWAVPVGAHAIDVLKDDMILRRATGEEQFVPFGADRLERPEPGEIILAEGDLVLTRRWTWRQANHTLVTGATKALVVNVDGLPPTGEEEIEAACELIMDLLKKYCRAETRRELFSRGHTMMEI